jgi:ParB-like chromosome segregation protein Spo0J
MDISKTQARHLQQHPAQMRTVLDVEEMVVLTLQMATRGWDEWQPLVGALNSDGTIRVISGHRRWLAALLAAEVHSRNGTEEIGEEFVRQVIGQVAAEASGKQADAEDAGKMVCPQCGCAVEEEVDDNAWEGYAEEEEDDEVEDLSEPETYFYCPTCDAVVEEPVTAGFVRAAASADLIRAYDLLATRHGDVEVPWVSFDGSDQKAEVLALQAANFGQETPDLLGQARSYLAALQAGATEKEIAANLGLPETHVRAVLALTQVPPQLAEAIAGGEIALGVAVEVAKLPQAAQRQGVAQFLHQWSNPTVESVAQVVSAIKTWTPAAATLDEQNPRKRNAARLLPALWAKALATDAPSAWATVARISMQRGYYDTSWFKTEPAYDSAEAALAALAPEATCEHCRLRELLAAVPEGDRSRFSRHYPCLNPKEATAGTCLHGIFAGDPFLVVVPWSWGDHPGVKRTGSGDWCCTSAEDFQAAVSTAQAAGLPVQAGDRDGEPNRGSSGYDDYYARSAVETPKDVRQQRVLIRSFMAHYAELSGASHPLATRCDQCQHRLDASPVKSDPNAPHCAWARGRRNVMFLIRAPEDEGAGYPEVPLCVQYASARGWKDTIPVHPNPPKVPREWLAGLIKGQVTAIAHNSYGRGNSRLTGEILTGCPMKADEQHNTWLVEGLEREIGNLSDGQLWTLLMWTTGDWFRVNAHHGNTRSGSYPLLLPDGRTPAYRDVGWRSQDFEAEGDAVEDEVIQPAEEAPEDESGR